MRRIAAANENCLSFVESFDLLTYLDFVQRALSGSDKAKTHINDLHGVSHQCQKRIPKNH